MKQILIDRYGPPEEVARCADVPDVRAPPAREVVGDALLFPMRRLARALGVEAMDVVRRAALFAELKALGADACVVDGPDLADAVRAQTGGAPMRLGLDAVSGRATARLSSCLAEGGIVCNYGS